MKTATLIENIGHSRGTSGDWRLYWLSAPLAGDNGESYEYVIVSAADAIIGPETYIFGSDEYGEVLNWAELEGSFRGSMDHERALRNAGYEVSQ